MKVMNNANIIYSFSGISFLILNIIFIYQLGVVAQFDSEGLR
jgi:hypothetical protein